MLALINYGQFNVVLKNITSLLIWVGQFNVRFYNSWNFFRGLELASGGPMQ